MLRVANVGALAAIMNAVVDALSPLGITHLDLPATPESVWRAIRNIPIVKAVPATPDAVIVALITRSAFTAIAPLG